MKEIKQRKERRFLKTLGRVGEILVEQVLLKLGSSIIKKIGGKKTLPSILFLLASLSLFAQYPNTLNKQRLGFQTTADGLVWRGSLSDTASIQPINNQNAWVILDTVNLKIYSFDFTSNVWNLVGGAQGLTMPFDSITFNTAKNGTVGVGEVEYNDTQGSLIQGLKGGNVTNVIGQQLHQRVNNRTGAPLAKGDVVYLAGSQGNRITVAKGLAVTDAFSANTFGVVAENIADNQSGFIITEGLITGLNTSSLTEDSAVYLSPTVAGALTSTKPQAPQHSVYIGVCVKSNNGSGELFVKIRNGQELDELHDVRITSPVDRASLYYKLSEKLWRDTTAALLVSDTASMLTNYLRTGTAASTYLPLTGGTLNISSSTNFLNTANDNANLTLYNSSSNGTNTIYNGLKFFVGAAGGAIAGGEGQANIYAIRRGSNLPGTDLSFILKGAGVNENEMLERLRIKYDGKVGIGTSSPSYLLDVNGTLGVTSNITANSFIKSGGTSSQFLKADGTVDGTSYLPLIGGTLSGNLNLSSGILNTWQSCYSNAPRNAGAISYGYFCNLRNSSGETYLGSRVIHNYMYSQDELTAAPSTMYYGRFNGFYAGNYNTNNANIIYDASIYYHNSNQFYYRAFSEPENKVTFSIKPSTTVDVLTGTKADLYLSGDAQIDRSLNIGTTLGVTGATTLSSTLGVTGATTLTGGINGNIKTNGAAGATATPDNIWLGNSYSNGTTRDKLKIYLYNDGTEKYGFGVGSNGDIQYHSNLLHDFYIANTKKFFISNTNTTTDNIFTVNNAAVFNEGAADADFRVESVGNAHMVFVDASTNRVGIGYASPTKTLDVNGEVRINTVTATPTSLLGKDGSNVVGNVTLGNSLTLSSGTLSVNNKITDINTSTYSILSTDYYIDNFNSSSTTITLPTASSNTYRELKFKNSSTGALIANANIIPLSGSGTTTTILPATNAKWCTLVSDGTYWRIMQSN